MRIIYLVVALAFCTVGLQAQPVNDECLTAIHLPNTDRWCSDPGQYTNVNGTPYSAAPPSNNCFLEYENDVWFTFIPQTPALYIKVSGATNNLGTLRAPGIAVFEGPCSNLIRVGCNRTSSTTNQVELSVEGLVIGKVYYLMVEGQRVGLNYFEGTFQICLEGFIPPPNPQSDCHNAVVLCDKSEFVVDTLLGVGIQDPDVTNTCVFQELSSAWYKWTCETSGSLTFTLTPNNFQPGFESDDIDFVVYELPNGIDNCSNKIWRRCMASGATGNNLQDYIRCMGPTGLRVGDSDITEDAGCNEADDNAWLAPLDIEAGKSYALLINNFSQSGLGFSIEWGGTSTFLGPKPAFDVTAVQAFECDKTIIFDNQSQANTDSIIAYYWNFGAGANPISSTAAGPHAVIYESFGNKRVALTVESLRGCLVTEILDFYIEPCCADTSTLAVSAIITDQQCPGTASGVIQGVGISGAPEYQFSLDCVDYQPSSVFPFLMPGDYTLCIQDEKGCESQVDVTINTATNFSVEAGDSVFLNLGQTTQLNAIPFPGLPSTVNWNNEQYFTSYGTDVVSRLSPTVLPRQSGWYAITIMNDAGCVATDSVYIFVEPYKPIYIPNVISVNEDGINDYLTVYGNYAATSVELFQIFDRWGGLLWERTHFDLNNDDLGWDGTSNGKPVNPGVFAYHAVVQFVDGLPLTFNGTVTVIR